MPTKIILTDEGRDILNLEALALEPGDTNPNGFVQYWHLVATMWDGEKITIAKVTTKARQEKCPSCYGDKNLQPCGRCGGNG